MKLQDKTVSEEHKTIALYALYLFGGVCILILVMTFVGGVFCFTEANNLPEKFQNLCTGGSIREAMLAVLGAVGAFWGVTKLKGD